MPHKYKLAITSKDTGVTTSLSGQFRKDDWESLEEFVQCAEELRMTKFVRDGMRSSLTIQWQRDTGGSISTELPPWDDVTVFLHKLRPIVLQRESTYFSKVCNILSKMLANPHVRGFINVQRRIFSGKRMQEQLQVSSNEVILNSDRVLYDWLNAYEYHRDKNKREFVESLHEMLPLDASKVLFLSLLSDKMAAICNLEDLVRTILGKQNESSIRIPQVSSRESTLRPSG